MSVLLPEGLPAVRILADEGLDVETHAEGARASNADLVIAILNLMPDKVATETQLIRMLADGPRRVETVLFATDTYMERVRDPAYSSQNTPVDHLRRFYRTFSEVRDLDIDGLIITGAPVEKEPYEDVPYWEELLQVFGWAEQQSLGVFNICWAAQAALQHFHGVPKYVLDQKLFGVFPHRIENNSPLLDGFGAGFEIPVSRHSEILRSDLPDSPDLKVLAGSQGSGLGLLEDQRLRHLYIFNHFEYDLETLKREYDRDADAGMPIQVPQNYYPDDDPSRPPEMRWQQDGRRLYQNWLATIENAKSTKN